MKKDKKILLLVCIGVAICLLSWFVSTGTFSAGAYTKAETVKAGIFDYFLILYYSLYYKCTEIFYLLLIGGCYGVLSKTASYRKLVSKTCKLIKGKEMYVLPVVTLIMGVWVSFSSQVLQALIFTPFIITVFLKLGKDKLTALSAGVGGLFIGLVGNTIGTYGNIELLSAASLKIDDGLTTKTVVFIASYVLFNLFAILHMRKNKKLVNETKADMFTTEKLDETNSKKKKAIWPILVLAAITFAVGICAYIDWSSAFKVTVFEETYTKMTDGTIKSILGSFSAFGHWSDLIPMAFALFVSTLVVSLVDLNIKNFIDDFVDGVQKIVKPTILYIFAMSIFISVYFFSWPTTLINAILSSDFNIINTMLVALVCGFFYLDPEFIGYTIGSHLLIVHADNILKSTILMRIGFGITTVIFPTSVILMFMLSYLDVKYTDWVKYIWKYVVSIAVAAMIIVAII